MKVTLDDVKTMVSDILSEAKKKKEKAIKLKHEPHPSGYEYSEAFDFSAPLGAYNLYKTQGAVNWGPMTSTGTKIDDRIAGQRSDSEKALRAAVREAIRYELAGDPSPWHYLSESIDVAQKVPANVWEAAQHWYDHMGLGLGNQTAEGIEEKKVGFKKMVQKLAHKKGVKDPRALAAHIGRNKYGSKGMAKKASAGKK